MFEKLAERGSALAQRRAAERRERLADRLEAAVPSAVQVNSEQDGVVLSGRGIVRRFALNPLMRWLVAEARDER